MSKVLPFPVAPKLRDQVGEKFKQDVAIIDTFQTLPPKLFSEGGVAEINRCLRTALNGRVEPFEREKQAAAGVRLICNEIFPYLMGGWDDDLNLSNLASVLLLLAGEKIQVRLANHIF